MASGGVFMFQSTRAYAPIVSITSIKPIGAGKTLGSGTSLKGEVDIEYASNIKFAAISLAFSLAVFFMRLENATTELRVSLMLDHFHTWIHIGLYCLSSLLTAVSFQYLFGSTYRILSIRWVILAIIATLELGSLLGSATPNSISGILSHAIAGVASASIIGEALIIIANVIPLDKRPTYAGLIGAMVITSLVFHFRNEGTSNSLNRGWYLYLDLPIGAVALAVVVVFFNFSRQQNMTTIGFNKQVNQIDLIGNAVFTPGIVELQVLSDDRAVGFLVLAEVLLAAFVVSQV